MSTTWKPLSLNAPLTTDRRTGPGGADLPTVQRWAAALTMPVGPAAVAVLRFVLPYNTTDSPAAMVGKVAVHPSAQRTVLWLGLLALFTLVPGAFAAVRLVRTRSPRLALLAGALLVPGYLALFWGGSDLDAYVGTRTGMTHTVAALVSLGAADPTSVLASSVFVVGHILGSVLLGVAFWRSRVMARPWALAMVVSQPLHLVAAMTGNHPLDLVAWGLTAAAMGAAARAVVRTPDADWERPAQ